MLHWTYAKNKFPFDINKTRRYTPYLNFATFDNDLQNPPVNMFWSAVSANPYALGQMRNIRQKMQDKFTQKNRHPGGARITPGWVGEVFVIFISAPNQADSSDHAYIFFKTGDDEINYQINKTFN